MLALKDMVVLRTEGCLILWDYSILLDFIFLSGCFITKDFFILRFSLIKVGDLS